MKRVFVIQNSWDGKAITLFSLFLRWLIGWDHSANLFGNKVYDMQALGRVETDFEAWLPLATRRVKVLIPQGPFDLPEIILGYGFLDLVQMLLWLIRKKLGIGRTWNGTDGVPKKWEGDFCSEFSAKCAHRPNPHLYTPAALVSDPYFVEEGEFTTEAGVGVTTGHELAHSLFQNQLSREYAF